MTLINDEDLLAFNLQGIIPGPDETEESLLERAAYCKELQTQCIDDNGGLLPVCENKEITQTLLAESSKITKPLYDIVPAWIPMVFSNLKLSPWHAGCAWIFQAYEDSPTGAFMQLRQQFRNRKKYLGLYQRDELVAHELSHVGRMMFEEPQFEELLAYRSSSSAWRRWLGPIVQAPWESLLFMLSLLLLLVLDLYLQSNDEIETYRMLLWAKLIPIVLLVLGLLRNWKRQKTFKSCLSKLERYSGDLSKANAIAYRLTDKEINLFASLDKEAIRQYSKNATTLRWRLIRLAYFNFE